MAIYNATGGENWNRSDNWGEGCPCENDWFGVTCDLDGIVQNLSLPFNNLVGNLPSELGNLANLGSLVLSGNPITSLPPSIGNIRRMFLVDLSETNLSELPDSFGRLTRLAVLRLNKVPLGELPETFRELGGLQTLELIECGLTELPPLNNGDLNSMERADFSGNQLTSLPDAIGDWGNLLSLSLSSNQFRELPELLESLALDRLSLADNPLPEVPGFLANLPSLDFLDLSDISELSCLPGSFQTLCERNTEVITEGTQVDYEAFCADGSFSCEPEDPKDCPEAEALMAIFDATGGENWVFSDNWGVGCPCENDWYGVSCNEAGKVDRIDLGLNNLKGDIPASISELSELIFLDLGENEITSLPNSIGELDKLEVLALPFNSLTELPESVGEMESLFTLAVYTNPLNSLPSTLLDLSELTFLSFSIQSEIPEFVGELTGLRGLRISGSQLTRVPDFLSNLRDLEVLNLNGNQLSSLPDFISTFSQLSSLRLRDNQFSTLPGDLVELENLELLELRGNPFSCYPASYQAFCDRGVNVIDGANIFTAFCATGGATCQEGPCPTDENLALGQSASQSSTYGFGIASIAVDGTTEGDNPWGSNPNIQHTQKEFQPWWQVDLGQTSSVTNVRIYNRSSIRTRLKDYYVFLSDQPFAEDASLAEILADPSIIHVYNPGFAGAIEEVPLEGSGRYVRIQLFSESEKENLSILHVAEVEVYGCSAGNENLRLAQVEEDSPLNSISTSLLYPNPFTKAFTLEIPNTWEASSRMTVFNTMGQIMEQKYLGDRRSLKLGSSWPAGMYIVELRAGQHIERIQVLKQ